MPFHSFTTRHELYVIQQIHWRDLVDISVTLHIDNHLPRICTIPSSVWTNSLAGPRLSIVVNRIIYVFSPFDTIENMSSRLSDAFGTQLGYPIKDYIQV